MIQSETLLLPWTFQDNMTSMFGQIEQYALQLSSNDDCGFSTLFLDEISPFDSLDDHLLELEIEEFRNLIENEESHSNVPSEQFSSSLEECLWSPAPSSETFVIMSHMQMPDNSLKQLTSHHALELVGPGCEIGIDLEIDNQRSILHLLEAYGEAQGNNQEVLAGEILRCLNQKGSLPGKTWERIAFYLSQEIRSQSQGDYLKQESIKNFEVAFKAFYQIFPFGKFAHFAANSAILEAIPEDADALHVIDFDIGEGVQWPPVIEALVEQNRKLRITSIKREEEEEEKSASSSSPRCFEEVKIQLSHHARCCGLNLRVEEMHLDGLVAEMKKSKKRGGGGSGGREFLAFNCMAALPHMGKSKSRKLVREFLTTAKGLLSNSGGGSISRGIVTFGDGIVSENPKKWDKFGQFFDENLSHYQAVLESIETIFPEELKEARMAMESLFIAPNISTEGLLRRWEEMKEDCDFREGMEGVRISRDTEIEAREMVEQEESSFGVKCGGACGNEIVLFWNQNPLVRVSAWKSGS